MRPHNFPQQTAPQPRQAAIDPEHAEQAAERARAVQWLAEHTHETTLSRCELERVA